MWGIVPDKIICTEQEKHKVEHRLSIQCQTINHGLKNEDIENVVRRLWLQFETNQREVKETFGNYVFNYSVKGKS
jgi:hypothetical protein